MLTLFLLHIHIYFGRIATDIEKKLLLLLLLVLLLLVLFAGRKCRHSHYYNYYVDVHSFTLWLGVLVWHVASGMASIHELPNSALCSVFSVQFSVCVACCCLLCSVPGCSLFAYLRSVVRLQESVRCLLLRCCDADLLL